MRRRSEILLKNKRHAQNSNRVAADNEQCAPEGTLLQLGMNSGYQQHSVGGSQATQEQQLRPIRHHHIQYYCRVGLLEREEARLPGTHRQQESK